MEEKPIIQELSMPIFQARGWMRLLGGVLFAQGILAVFTIVGIIICWLPIWLGILLFKAAGLVETAQISGDKVQLLASLQKLKTYFVINGVLMLIMLIFLAIGLLASGGAIFSMMDQFGC